MEVTPKTSYVRNFFKRKNDTASMPISGDMGHLNSTDILGDEYVGSKIFREQTNHFALHSFCQILQTSIARDQFPLFLWLKRDSKPGPHPSTRHLICEGGLSATTISTSAFSSQSSAPQNSLCGHCEILSVDGFSELHVFYGC